MKVYQYYQPNKKDLKDEYGDCVIRALTKALDIKWAFTKEEKYAERWLKDNGFVIQSIKQFLAHTIFTVSKDGVIY